MRILPSTQLLINVQSEEDAHVFRDKIEIRDALDALSNGVRGYDGQPDPKTIGATVGWTSDPEVIATFCKLASQYAKSPDGKDEENKPLVSAPDPFQKSMDAGIGQRLFYVGDAQGKYCAGVLVGAPWTTPVPIESLRLFERNDDLAYETLCSGRYAYVSTFVGDASLGVKGLIPKVFELLKTELDEDVAILSFAQIARERDIKGGKFMDSSATVAALVGHHRSGFVRAGWSSTFQHTPGLVVQRPSASAAIPEPILFSLAICPASRDRNRWHQEADISSKQIAMKAWTEAAANPWRPFDTNRVWALNDACHSPHDSNPLMERRRMMADLWVLKPTFPIIFPEQFGSQRLPPAAMKRLLDLRLEQLATRTEELESVLEDGDEADINRAMCSLSGGVEAAQAVWDSPSAPNLKQAKETCVRQKLGLVLRLHRQTEAALKFAEANSNK